MIRRCLVFFSLLLMTIVNGFCADYVGKEKKYYFSSQNIQQSILAHIDTEDKQIAVAQEYVKLVDSNGNVSIEDLFSVCRVAGFNTYRQEGYNKCRAFITTLLENAQIEADDGIMGGFCPGLDANGRNPNNLQTITDKTRIGDVCKSSHIYAGEVVFKKGYNCTCMAYACNPGYYIKGGACLTEEASKVDGMGNCLRTFYPGSAENNSREKCFAFCGKMGEKNKCKANTSIWYPKDNKCLCNATYDEVDNVRQNNIESLPYRAVCGADKGKTGGKEYCVKMFSSTNVGMIQATGLAAEYALLKHNKVVHCSDKYRKESNDDWVQCTTEDKKTFYEFQFDDVVESVDGRIQSDLTTAICQLHGKSAMDINGNIYMDACKGSCDEGLKKTSAKFGMKTISGGNYCELRENLLGKNDKDKLAKIDGLDNYIFYHGIQIQGNQDLVRKLRQYIASTGKYEIKSFTCDKGVGKIKNGNIETDDILRCYLNGQPIDFVLDDNSEAWKTYQKAGKQAMNCIVNGGTYSGKGCLGLSEQVCQAVAKQDKKSCPECGAARWDANLQQCILPAGAAARNLEQGIKVGTIVVTAVAATAVTVATGGTAGAGAALLLVEVVGATIETVSTVKIQQAAVDFLNASNRCKDASCAETMIKNNLQRLANMQNDFAAAEVNAIDSEMARLFELVPETSSLYNGSKLSANQISMFESGSWEPEQVWRAIGVGLQMASLVTSIGKWILGKVPRLAKTTAVVTTKMQRALPAATTKTTKALAAHTDDVVKGAIAGSDDVLKALPASADNALKALPSTADDALKALPQSADNALKALPANADNSLKALPATADDALKALPAHADDIIWDPRVQRYRNVRNGQFVAGGKSWTKELADIGVKETIVDGKAVYTDLKTGAQLSDVQVLNKMPTSWNDEMAQYGLRQIEQSNGSVRYMDVSAEGANKFISQENGYNRIGEILSSGNKTDDVATSLAKVDDVADATRAAGNAARSINDFDDAYRVGQSVSSRAEILQKWGLKADATDAEIAKRFRQLQSKFHPDRAGPDKILAGQLDEVFKDIGQEKDLLDKLPRITNNADNAAGAASNATRNANRTADAATDATRNAGKTADSATDATRATAGASRNINDFDNLYQIGYNATSRDEILKKWGLHLGATDDEIAKRWKDLAKKFHPDKAGSDSALRAQMESIMADINREHDLLGSLKGTGNTTGGFTGSPTNNNVAGILTSGTNGSGATGVANTVKPATTSGYDFSNVGHDLFGITAGSRAAERGSQQ